MTQPSPLTPNEPPLPRETALLREAEQLAERVDQQLLALKSHRSDSGSHSTVTARHVLHVDDSEDDRLLFSHAFAQAKLDATLHSLCDVTEAFLFLTRLGAYATAPRPNLIVLDLNLPDRDGRYLLTVLKSSVYLKGIPVVILSGSENFADIQKCRDLRVDDYMVKPRTSQELIEVIASMRQWLTKTDANQVHPPHA